MNGNSNVIIVDVNKKNLNHAATKGGFVVCFFCVFFVFFLLFSPTKAYCYQYTLEEPTNSDIIVTVSVTPDIGKNWGYLDDAGKDHHLVAMSMAYMPATVRVSASYRGSYEGSVTSCLPNAAGSDFTNDWVEDDSTSSTLMVPEDDLLPTIGNGYSTEARIHFGFLVHYDETIGNQTYQNVVGINGELILDQLLTVSAGIDRFSKQMMVGVYEITGFDGVSPLWTQMKGNATLSFGNSGKFTLWFDKQDEDGVYFFNIAASLGSDFDASGYTHDVISIHANANGVIGTLFFNASVGFAVVAGKSGISRLLAREDVIMDPRDLIRGEILLPGDTVGVISGELLLRYANSESSLVTSTTPTRIVLGSSGIASERSYISFWAENIGYDIQNDPRKYARFFLFQAAGAGVSSMLPGVHWVFKIGASTGSKCILNFFAGHQSGKKAGDKSLYFSKTASDDSIGSRAVVNIFPGGAIMFHPLQGQALLDFGSNTTTLAAGSLSMGDLEADVPFLSRPGGEGYSLSNVAYGLSARWFGSGSEIHTRTPTLGISVDTDPYTRASMINPDYIEVRLNGRLVADAGIDQVSKIVRNIVVSPEAPLKAGSNILEAWLEEANRPYRHKITGSLTVAGDAFAEPPSKITAFSSDAQELTIVRWTTPPSPDILGYEIGRSETESGTFTLLSLSPCSQRAWLDDWKDNPPSVAYWYRVRTVYENDMTSNWSAPVRQQEAEWHDGYSAFGAPANSRVSNIPGGLLIQFDDNMPDMVFWKLERGMSATGPWADLLQGEYLAASGYQDADITPDAEYWYRLTSLSILGDGPESTVIGPVVWDGQPVPPTGLTCYIDKGTAKLRWDPVENNTVHAFRIYRNSGAGFQPISSVPSTTTVYQDRIRATGTYDWVIKSVSAAGRESRIGTGTGVHHISIKASGQITLGVATEYQSNGERTATVPLYRTGGSTGPLLVTVNLNQVSDTGTETKGKYGGTILFADGETSKLLTTSVESGYHLDRFIISATFGLNTASGIFPWPMFLPALTNGR